jgi:pyruvate/2-oxoglutarate dehydrogenase complex dihydrolipoamide acyltransferase (E2) component
MKRNNSVIRTFLTWWFKEPASPWVSVNIAIDFTFAEEFLGKVNQGAEVKITIQHLVMASIAKALMETPAANARIINNRIYEQDHVGIGYPINLLGHKAGKERELSVGVLANVDQLSLRDIAIQCRESVSKERSGKITNPFIRMLFSMMKRAPHSVVHKGLDQFQFLLNKTPYSNKIYEYIPVTTGITNPGAAIPDIDGILYRGAAINLPSRILHIGTLWGVSKIQSEVIPIQGKPTVRPMLPITLIFDHRLIDGVKASKLLLRFSEKIRNPSEHFSP